jgi:hypothetical protein
MSVEDVFQPLGLKFQPWSIDSPNLKLKYVGLGSKIDARKLRSVMGMASADARCRDGGSSDGVPPNCQPPSDWPSDDGMRS